MPQTKFYNEVGQECVAVGCSVDLFLFNNAYIDVATLSQVRWNLHWIALLLLGCWQLSFFAYFRCLEWPVVKFSSTPTSYPTLTANGFCEIWSTIWADRSPSMPSWGFVPRREWDQWTSLAASSWPTRQTRNWPPSMAMQPWRVKSNTTTNSQKRTESTFKQPSYLLHVLANADFASWICLWIVGPTWLRCIELVS